MLVLGAAAVGGCFVLGALWIGIGAALAWIFGAGTPIAHWGAITLTAVAIVVMLVYIRWLVMGLLPRLENTIDRGAARLRRRVGLSAPPPEADVRRPDPDEARHSSPTLAELDARLQARPENDRETP